MVHHVPLQTTYHVSLWYLTDNPHIVDPSIEFLARLALRNSLVIGPLVQLSGSVLVSAIVYAWYFQPLEKTTNADSR